MDEAGFSLSPRKFASGGTPTSAPRAPGKGSMCALKGLNRLFPLADLRFHLVSILGQCPGSERSLRSHGLHECAIGHCRLSGDQIALAR